jgi:hypothetical protein
LEFAFLEKVGEKLFVPNVEFIASQMDEIPIRRPGFKIHLLSAKRQTRQ